MKKVIIFFLLLMILSLPVLADTFTINGIGEISNEEQSIENIEVDGQNVWTTLFSKYSTLILGFAGIAFLTLVLIFVFNFVKLGKVGDNPTERSKALNALLWTGFATAILGSITVITAFAYNFLN